MNNAVKEPCFRVLLLMVLEKMVHAQCTTVGMQYKLQIEDKFLNDTVTQTFRNQNKIHCATLCCMEKECIGFGVNNVSCSLLNRFVNNETCKAENCFEIPGMKIYMKVRKSEVITTTSTLPTTEQKSTEESITTTTYKTTDMTSNIVTSTDESTTTTTEKIITTEKSRTTVATSTKASTLTSTTSTEQAATSTTEQPTTSTIKPTSTTTTEEASTNPTSKQASESTTPQQDSTAITEEASTSTTEEASVGSAEVSSTSTPTTKVTEDASTTTTTGPFNEKVVPLVCDMRSHVLQGISSRETMFFGSTQYQTACVAVGTGSCYQSEDEKPFTFSPPEKGTCSGYKYPGIKHIDLKIENKILKEFTLYCGELKEENVVKDSNITTTTSVPENKKISCKDKQVIVGFTATRYEEGHYKVEADCRELQNPAESQDTSDVVNTDLA